MTTAEKPRYPARVFKYLRRYPVRHCESCGKQLTPRMNTAKSLETVAQFETRRTCNRVCRGALRKKLNEPKPKVELSSPAPEKRRYKRRELEPRTCEVCEKQFGPTAQERPVQFRRRPTCSRECAAVLGAAKTRKTFERKAFENPLDENSREYGDKTKEALRLFHDRYPGMTPHVAWQDYGEDATTYWLECLDEAGAIGQRST